VYIKGRRGAVRRFRLLAVLAVLIPGPSAAQVSGAGAFLLQDPNARTAALAGATGAITDDAHSVLINPAALSRLIKPEVAATRVILFEDTSYDAVAGAFSSRRWGGFGAAYVRQASGGFERRTGPNDSPTTFSVEQSAFVGGWGYSPSLSWIPGVSAEARPLAVGLAVKSVRESIASASAAGTGVDASLLLSRGENARLGLTFMNMVAPAPAFIGAARKYPRVVDISPAYGLTFGPDWRVELVARLRRVESQALEPSGGLELRYGRLAALRLGAKADGPSTGFGLSWGNSRVDYSALLHDLGISHSVTFVQRFGQTREELEETIRRGISRLSRSDGARLAKAYLQKAEQEVRADRLADARRNLEAASLLDPGNREIAERLNRVDALWEEGLKRQTLERLSSLAKQQHEQGNLPAARQYWRSALDLDEKNAEARREIDRIDATLSTEERSRADTLRRAQEVNEIAQALADAATHLAHGMLRQARLAAEKILARSPDNAAARNFLARVRTQLEAFVAERKAEAEKATAARDYPKALEALQSAKRQAPDDEDLPGLIDAAQGELRRALTPEARKQAEQLYYRAVEQYLKGSYTESGALVEEVLKLDPSSDSARALKEKVEGALRLSR